MSKEKSMHRLSITIIGTNRAEIRAEVFQHWIREEPGTPELTNCYRYDVEKLSDGSLIYVTRPTRLNKGADFRIFCENFKRYLNGNDKPPSHANLVDELKALIANSEENRKELLNAVQKLWDCEPSTKVLAGLKIFSKNPKAERVLLLAKWFFIEQDVTYWIESGRHMLLGHFVDTFGELQ
jgi:hypothetical protein